MIDQINQGHRHRNGVEGGQRTAGAGLDDKDFRISIEWHEECGGFQR